MHIQVERNGSTVILGLPAKGQDMMDCLRLIGVTDPFDTVFTVTNIRSEVPELSRLEGREWDIDHLNLLARYMFGMDRNEIKQFSAAIYASDCNDLTDLINLSQNLNNYTLIDSRWDLNAIGRKHVLNTEGGMPEEEYNKRDFAGIAVDLLRSPNIVETPYGIVHINGLEEQRVFNGRNMPQYIDGGFSIMCRAEYTCRSEYLCLPCDEVDLEKALHRLGADDFSQVSIDIEEIRFISETDCEKSGFAVADGMIKEFKIAKEKSCIIIPLGSTGWAAEYIFKEVARDIPSYPYLTEYLEILRSSTNTEELIRTVCTIVNQQQIC